MLRGVTGEYSYFEIKRGDLVEELGERLDFAGRLLYRSVELGERSVALGERTVELTEQSVALGEKNVALGEESVAIGRAMLAKQDETIEGIRELGERQEETVREIQGLRTDLKSYMEERFDRLEQDVMAIKAKLGMV